MKKTGILITNTGTPDAATIPAVRRYLREFLSDKRIVQLPRFVWLPILHGLVLPFRSKRSTQLYQSIWTEDGSPMRTIMQTLKSLLQQKLNTDQIIIEIGMNYGNPNINQAIENLRKQQVSHIMALPLFPQYSNTTSASTFDRIQKALTTWPSLPHLHFIRDYASHPQYISALANSVRAMWNAKQRTEHLLISFHGIPERFVEKGDPYAKQCEQTAHLLAEALQLNSSQWTLCYQSQFGYDKWLKPSTQALFTELPKRGIHHIDVICPGFSIDCLETLEEINLRGQEQFLQAGGKTLNYIPALNATTAHIDMLIDIISSL